MMMMGQELKVDMVNMLKYFGGFVSLQSLSVITLLSFPLLDVQYKSYRVEEPVGVMGPDPYEHVYDNLPNNHHVLEEAANCIFCGAKRFTGEGPAFCCRKGKVLVHITDAPAELRRLFTRQTDEDAIYFRKHIQYFNSHFSHKFGCFP